jgi:hypothetical protein
MALTEEQKHRIDEEEAYQAKIREESHYRNQISSQKSKKGSSGCFTTILVILALPILLAITLLVINPGKQFEQAEKARLSTITPFPAIDIVDKTEGEIKTTYAPLYSHYSDTGLTPSGKVKITGFDIPTANVQIDYVVETNKPVYIGYSFAAKPLEEEAAWKVTGISKPTEDSTSNPGIMNRTVYVWENSPEIEPYKMVQAIYESDGKVGKIAFSMEDLTTAQSNRSVYYVL